MPGAQRMAHWRSTGVDRWEVWVCDVPSGTTAEIYEPATSRVALEPGTLVGRLAGVTTYFATISHGVYRPTFAVGGRVQLGTDDGPQECVDAALARSGPAARGVLVVASALHRADRPGGSGNPGADCAQPCAAAASRRNVYVGASDFLPEWGDRPPLDLVEHEIGHALGWPHSGYDESFAEPHRSALDVMSDSASPRRTKPDRRDAPDTLAINRAVAGWLPVAAVVAVPTGGAAVSLSPSTGDVGVRLLTLPGAADTVLTVELLTADGFDDHLPATGIAVHRVQGSGPSAVVTPLVGLAPFTEFLQPGQHLDTDGWRIEVADAWNLRVTRLG